MIIITEYKLIKNNYNQIMQNKLSLNINNKYNKNRFDY